MEPRPLHSWTEETDSAARELELIIPGDRELERPPRMLYVKRSGRILIEDYVGNRISLNVCANDWIPLSPVKVLRTGRAIVYCVY